MARTARRLVLLGLVAAVAGYRKRRLDAADRAFPEATRPPTETSPGRDGSQS